MLVAGVLDHIVNHLSAIDRPLVVSDLEEVLQLYEGKCSHYRDKETGKRTEFSLFHVALWICV